jgi:hypothetical protein
VEIRQGFRKLLGSDVRESPLVPVVEDASDCWLVGLRRYALEKQSKVELATVPLPGTAWQGDFNCLVYLRVKDSTLGHMSYELLSVYSWI